MYLQKTIKIDVDHLLLLWIVLCSGVGLSLLAHVWDFARWHIVDKERARRRRRRRTTRKGIQMAATSRRVPPGPGKARARPIPPTGQTLPV